MLEILDRFDATMLTYGNDFRAIERRLLKILTVFGIVMTMTVIGSVPGASALVFRNNTRSIQWGNCTDPTLSKADAECGFLSVPLDYTRPHGPKIQLAVSRITHTVPHSKFQGIMLAYPSGPGVSGLGLATLGKKVPNMAGEAYDWIGFDPRGVGSSMPALSCLPNNHTSPRPNYTPSNEAVEKFWLKRSKNYAMACAENNGKLLEYMTTSHMVQDIERLRIALGQSTINFYGQGYGTYLGQVYATSYPHRVRRMVLDSNLDPRTIWLQYN